MSNQMTRELWTEKLEAGMGKLQEIVGKRVPAPIMGKGEHHPNTMPLCNRMITEDMIRLYASAIGDPNPLWVDDEYAKQTRWGSIIAPPMCEVMIAEAAAVPAALPLPGLTYMNGGSTRKYHKMIRPRDEFKAIDIFKGVVEKSNPKKPYRLFIETGEREFYNQNDELVLTVTSNILVMARYPEEGGTKKEVDFSDAKRHRFTDEELAIVHQSYDDELNGTYRQGLIPKVWEDVKIGEELHPLYKGPYDYSDAASFFGVTGYSMAFAKKWAALRNNLDAFRRDSETNEYHLNPDWHFSDDLARKGGVPFAPIFGTHIEASMVQGLCNWMGDNARIVEISSQIRTMIFMGDVFICKGKVTDKYEQGGQKYVSVELWAEKFGTDIVCAKGTAVVEL